MKNKKLIKAEMLNDELFQNMLNVAVDAMELYDVVCIHAIEVYEKLIEPFGKENTDWFYDIWNEN